MQMLPATPDGLKPPEPDELDADRAASYESLLDQVWRSEREWRFDDRLAMAARGWPR